MSEQKIYVGKGKKRGDRWLSVTINPDKLAPHVKEYEGTKYVKLNINILERPDQYGKDVSITVDTYEPPAKTQPQTASHERETDLPF